MRVRFILMWNQGWMQTLPPGTSLTSIYEDLEASCHCQAVSRGASRLIAATKPHGATKPSLCRTLRGFLLSKLPPRAYKRASPGLRAPGLEGNFIFPASLLAERWQLLLFRYSHEAVKLKSPEEDNLYLPPHALWILGRGWSPHSLLLKYQLI